LCTASFACADLLHEAVEETVTLRGGEVLERESGPLTTGLAERMRLTVVIPLLWGVPPQDEVIAGAIAAGGGIVHRVVKEWGVYYGAPSTMRSGGAGGIGSGSSSSTGEQLLRGGGGSGPSGRRSTW
jgi:hypothetical protein